MGEARADALEDTGSAAGGDFPPRGGARRRARGEISAGLLLLPLFAMLFVVFICPLVWFFVQTFAEVGRPAEILHLFARVLLSSAVEHTILATIWISLVVTIVVLLVAYPLAYVLSQSRGLTFTLITVSIVLPYFTSVIVRTYSWMVVLGRNGLINQVLLGLGVIHQPLALMYNWLGVLIGMVYVLLPYMSLTLYAVMRGIDPNLLKAARSMGASGGTVFGRIYLPLSLPGVLSGSLIVFILAIGFFITPALMGGPGNVMISMLIEQQVELTLNWPLAAVMSLFLLVITIVLYSLYCRFANVERMFG
ncbi:MAG: ABC transporter permease [Stellaceae bacterium]